MPQAWHARSIDYFVDDSSPLLQGAERRQLVERSFAAWIQPCTDLEFRDRGTATVSGSLAERISVRAASSTSDEAMFMGSEQLAHTCNTYNTESGEIVEADILLNGIGEPLAEVTDVNQCKSQMPMPFDLENTLTHEIGHALGFDHSTDPESTMYAVAPSCEIKKRDLTADDILGLCTVYPKGQPNGTCDRFLLSCKKGCGCTSTPRANDRGTPWAMLLFAAIMIGARERRRLGDRY
jgi:MYXO-CTERM domain-containing protein